jgi:hypothetical protein
VSARSDSILEAARLAAVDWRGLLRISRPAWWLLSGGLFLAGAYEAQRDWSAAVVVGTLYFLGPINLLRRGLDDVARGDPDRPEARSMRVAIAVTNLPFLVVLVLLGGATAGLALLATVALVIAETTRPIRLRSRPVADLAIAGLLVAAPAACGLLVGGRDIGALPWIALAAAVVWGSGAAAVETAEMPTPGSTAALLGRRGTAVVALVADAAVVALVAALGGIGLLAAFGLALFLLLPLTVLAAGSPGAGGSPGAAHVGRARADLPGLMVLVGGWIGVLLLQYWGITKYGPWTVAVVVPTVLAGYAVANMIAIRIVTRRHRVPAALQAMGDDGPPVTIVVPCHDAAGSLPTGLAALRAQTYPDTSVLVVDDDSTDGSADEAAAWIGADAVLRAPPRPDGWTSRAWARHVGATTATSDLILFVDPGVVLSPIAVRVLVEQCQTRSDDLLLGLPRDLLATSAERAAVPGFSLVQFGFAPLWWPALTGDRPAALAFGDGGLVLVRRSAYLGSAGLDPTAPEVAGAIVEPSPPDDSLPRMVARTGSRVAAVRMANLAAERRYRRVGEVITAWRRRILPFGRGRLAGAVAIVGVVVVAYVMPLLLPPIAILGGEDPTTIAASFVPLAALLVARLALVITQRQSLATIAWHPVTVAIMLIGQVGGIVDHVLGRDGS